MKKIILFITMLAVATGVMTAFAASDRMVSTADFSYVSFDKVTKRAKITFDINANTISDGIVGIASSTVTPKNYSDYAICFRIREGGFFDSNNGNSFDKAGDVYYTKNTTYSVEIDADITNQIYNAYVYIDGEKKIVADNYAFRASAGDFGKITARNGGKYSAGLYYIENIVIEESDVSFETFTLPNFFAENMVLQRNEPHVIYGKATGDVTVTLSRGDVSSSATAKAVNGRFEAQLDEVPTSLEPYTLTVSAKDKVQVIENVFVGDVYLLAGQSNMAQNYEHQTSEQLGDGVTTSNMPEMITDERIKFFKLSRTPSSTESFDVPFETDGWQTLTDATKKKLSYIGMFFATERLKEESEVPIGLMSVAWRGTTINRWMRKSDDNKSLNYTPTNGDIFNNHVAPLTKYPISAVLWYQGESDASNPVMYEEAFQTLIKDWRNLWNDEDLPFLYVQLARYGKDNYASLRNAQLKALKIENTGMAVILDTDKGTYNNIHPLGKETVAKRLHLLAKKYVYGEDVVAEGPIFEHAEVKDGEIIVSFREDTIGEGLCIKNTYGAITAQLCEFEIADRAGNFVEAKAVINEDNTITVSAEGVNDPLYVRYAYSAVPENPNLFNKNGLPASPFTTDVRIFSEDSFLTRGVEIENSDVQLASYKVTPTLDNINGVMGFTDTDNTVTAWNNCGITVRFKENGFFEYIDGASFVTSSLAYKSGQTYDVSIIADFADKTYSVIVDGAVIAEKAAFRTGSLEMHNIGRFLVRGGDGEKAGEFFLEDVDISVLEDNTLIDAKRGEENVSFVVSPSEKVYAARYNDDMLSAITSMESFKGVKLESADKIFIWDVNLSPVR